MSEFEIKLDKAIESAYDHGYVTAMMEMNSLIRMIGKPKIDSKLLIEHIMESVGIKADKNKKEKPTVDKPVGDS